MHFIVYILFSNTKDRYYVGYTSEELAERLRKHNSNHEGFTGGLGDWQIKYKEVYNSKAVALQREKKIKNWKSRKQIEKLIISSSE